MSARMPSLVWAHNRHRQAGVCTLRVVACTLFCRVCLLRLDLSLIFQPDRGCGDEFWDMKGASRCMGHSAQDCDALHAALACGCAGLW